MHFLIIFRWECSIIRKLDKVGLAWYMYEFVHGILTMIKYAQKNTFLKFFFFEYLLSWWIFHKEIYTYTQLNPPHPTLLSGNIVFSSQIYFCFICFNWILIIMSHLQENQFQESYSKDKKSDYIKLQLDFAKYTLF